ncbi:MAG: SGNH/GDSL hydrolase family protein [Actinomycetota bacterium]
MFVRRVVLLSTAVLLAAACGSQGTSIGPGPSGTIPVGGLPSVLPTVPPPTALQTTTTWRTTTTLALEDQIGSRSQGNRVIVIGDSVIAATSTRYTNDMCKSLVPLGWRVEVDAESGRFVDFGNAVLDDRLAAGWDAGVVLLGNNYSGSQSDYRDELTRIVDRLSPNPVVLLTVSEFEENRRQVNEVIRALAEERENVTIVDWATTTVENDGLTGGDNLHLTIAGRRALAEDVGLALGVAPQVPGECMESSFVDDSMGSVNGTTTTVSATPTSKRPTSSSTSTTTAAVDTTGG